MKETKTCPICKKAFEVNKGARKVCCSYSCRSIKRRQDYPAKLPKTSTCLFCHKEFTTTNNGQKFCSRECLKRAVIRKKCAQCGVDFIAKAKVRFCPSCRKYNKTAYEKSEHYRAMHSKLARQWQKSNREKQRAAQLAQYHHDKLSILYECPHYMVEKHNHHFDYSRPFEVIRLCEKCHTAEHKRLRAAAKNHPKRTGHVQGEADASNASAVALCTRADSTPEINRTGHVARGE